MQNNYTYGYWLNGYRRIQGDTSPDALCFETGTYGFMLEPTKLSSPRFGVFDKRLSYQQALEARATRMDSLKDARLDIELAVNGKTYRAESAKTRFSMWDSGRIAQYFTLLDLNFTDEAGKRLSVYGDLNLVAWPGSLNFTVDALEPTDRVAPGKVGNGWTIGSQPLDIPHRPEMESEQLTLEMWVKPTKLDGRGWLVCKNENEWGTGHFGIAMTGAKAAAVMNNAGGPRKEVSIPDPRVLTAGAWAHLALTYDGKVMRFYINGEEKGNKPIGITRTKGNGLLRIGQRADGNSSIIKGTYDQVRLWNRALSAADIKAHWQAPGALSNRDGLVLDKTFDEKELQKQADWQDAKLRLSLKAGAHQWQEEKVIKGSWKLGEKKQISVNCNLEDLYETGRNVRGALTYNFENQRFPLVFDLFTNCYLGYITGLKRSFEGGYTKITDYDEFDLVLDCADPAPQPVPFLLYLKGAANITGFVPILCKPDGTPTGIPVQLSKNWHNHDTGQYLRAYSLIPVKQGRNQFRLRIPYGFYGSVPSASHAQLCLLGGKGGGGQRWDQLALACGGESLCLDMDQSLTDMVMTDIRVPLGRWGKEGNPWGWTEGGWGGEWLGVFRDKAKLPMAGMKAAYLSHGPCLTDVRYSGAYGSDRAVLLDAKVEFPRSDDYARTFQKVSYRFQREFSAKDSYLHRLFPAVPDKVISYGNADGLLGEARVSADAKTGDVLILPTELTGRGPWWVAFPERDKSVYTGSWKDSGWVGYPAIIIRDYRASFGGELRNTIWLTATRTENSWRKPGVDTRLLAGPDVTTYQPGDYVEVDLEWAHLAPVADNYGGPNQAYRTFLEANPNSWKVAHREAVGNDIDVEVEGGTLLQELPIVVRADKPEVTVAVKGGVGCLPIRFENLKTADGYAVYEIVDGQDKKLDQSVHGNDYWQTDYDAGSGTYKMSFNLPVDGKTSSQWTLKRTVRRPMMTLWYDKPATDWQKEALPIGNGRLGAMVFGGVEKEHIQFNEDTVWIGDEEDTGSYQAFGDIMIHLKVNGSTGAYRRGLDIDRAVQSIVYERDGVTYRREYFASHPADVLVVRLTADSKGAYTGAIALRDAHGRAVRAEGSKLLFSGTLSGKYGKPNENYAVRLQYEAQVQVINEGGSLEATDGRITFQDCDSLTILVDGGTDYLNQHDKDWKREHPHERIAARLLKAAARSFDELLQEHIEDYQALFNRVELDVGRTPAEAREQSTDRRLAAYKQGGKDPELEELLFQYPRYLMISSSRPGCLPANLQGLWNNSNRPPWRCDYHSDVNIQMNYWFVDQANLSECFTPLSEWLWSVVPVKREATRKAFGVRGWAHRSENGIFGGASYHWVPGDAAWIMQNIWDHYAFTRDREYLETRAYPLLKELCEFWEDSLIEWPNGKLVSPESISPEHGPKAEGNSYEQQLVYDLFTNYIEAAKALGWDEEFRKKVESMRSRLLGPQIGKWGQLQEWAEDLDNPNDQHRHLSHLIAVHPGRQISPLITPELAEAAEVSMNARGDGATGWSKAWKINIWARLHDGDRAYKLLNEQIKGNYYPNLFGFHPPFQIDGNFGYASGVCEMLLQSHMGDIHLLPALPAQWPAGAVKGLGARGDYTVDIHWLRGELVSATLYAGRDGRATVRYGDHTRSLDCEAGKTYSFNSQLQPIDGNR